MFNELHDRQMESCAKKMRVVKNCQLQMSALKGRFDVRFYGSVWMLYVAFGTASDYRS